MTSMPPSDDRRQPVFPALPAEKRAILGGVPWEAKGQTEAGELGPPDGRRLNAEPSTAVRIVEPATAERPSTVADAFDGEVIATPLELLRLLPWREWIRRATSTSPPWAVSLSAHVVLLLLLLLVSVRLPRSQPVQLELRFTAPGPVGPQAAVVAALPVREDADPEVTEPEMVDSRLPPVESPHASPSREPSEPDRDAGSSSSPARAVGTLLNGREAGSRRLLATGGGGSDETESAVERALAWLVSRQEKRGPAAGLWSLVVSEDVRRGLATPDENRLAATAMALLAFQGAGHTHRSGSHARNVAAAWQALKKDQHRKDGDPFDGTFGCGRVPSLMASGRMYAHGQITIAACELFGMTRDPAFEDLARRAVGFCLRAQLPDGGWRYELPDPEQSPRAYINRGDLSVTGWYVLALKSSQMAGLEIGGIDAALQRAGAFIDSLALNDHAGRDNGYDYTRNSANSRSQFQPAMTAEALLSRLYLGCSLDDPKLTSGVQRLVSESPIAFPTESEPFATVNVYAWYHITQVCHHIGGEPWRTWNTSMVRLLPGRQEKDGSWSPAGDLFGSKGGRLFMTALSCCMLEVYYRHLPLYGRLPEVTAAVDAANPPAE
jgi:hypothetical protein